MRFNKLELIALASQTSQNFEREGVLVLKERQDSFFRRSEGCSARWFRLRGNLLFYLKGPESWYEPLGVIILGNHQVTVQTQDENGHWPFQLDWENGVCYRLATFLESERTAWLKAMENSSYQNVVQRIADLNRQLNDTRTMIDLRKFRNTNQIINDFDEVPLCELSLSCDNLLCDANGNPPSAFASTYVLFPERDLSVRYCSTEVVERCSNPNFSRTVMLRASDGVGNDALIRIAVYDIRETFTQTGVTMGSVTLPFSDVQEAQRLRVPLMTLEERTVGFVTINGRSLEPTHAGSSPSHPNTECNPVESTSKAICHRRSQSLPPRLGLTLKYPSYGELIRLNYVNPNQATYRFQSGLGGDIIVHEAIAEPRFCFTMPLQLVEIYMAREKALLETMLAFAEFSKRVAPSPHDSPYIQNSVMNLLRASNRAQGHVSTHLAMMRLFQTAKNVMVGQTKCFKPSVEKEKVNMAFVPVNLHLQRMWVHNDTLNKTGFHDVITVGAFAAHSHLAEKTGGLIKLLQHFKDFSTQKAEMMANSIRLDAELEKLRLMKCLRGVIKARMESAILLAQASKFTEAKAALDDIQKNVNKFLELWEYVTVEDALTKIGWNKNRTNSAAIAGQFPDELLMQAYRMIKPEGASDNMQSFCSSMPHVALKGMATAHAVLSDPTRITEEDGTVAVLTALTESCSASATTENVPFPSSSSSSVDTTPTSDIAYVLSASVPDMQKGTLELQFHTDYFKSECVENSPQSERSSGSGQNEHGNMNGKKNNGWKNQVENVKNDNANKKNDGERNGRGWNNSFRSARGAKPKTAEVPPPAFERKGSLKTDFKSSASLEQVSYKSIVNNKKAEKKKAKKNRRDRANTPPIPEADPNIREYNLQFFKDITTSIEDMLHNIVAVFSEVIKMGINKGNPIDDTKTLMDLLLRLLDEAHKWMRMGHTAMRIETEAPDWGLEYASLQSRRDSCFSQALTTATAGLMCWLASVPSDVAAKVIQSGLGPLCGFEGLLSLYAQEKTMWGDMVIAIEDLHTVLFKLVKDNPSSPMTPQITGARNALIVEIPVSDELYARFDQTKDERPTFTVTAVLFNVGINEKATVAGALGECKPQQYSNKDNLERLHKYYLKYSKLFPSDAMEPIRASSRSKPLEEVMENLRTSVCNRSAKNIDLLQLACQATRLMNGIRFTSCKSAKDRTGMSVTLEQTNILSTEYHLADHQRQRALDIMRSEGCRRENTMKNIGSHKYAFTKKQVQSLPEEYRPPTGSYGHTVT